MREESVGGMLVPEFIVPVCTRGEGYARALCFDTLQDCTQVVFIFFVGIE